jgi:hypothetical protein
MSKRDISIGAGLRKFMITAGGKYNEIKILDKRKTPHCWGAIPSGFAPVSRKPCPEVSLAVWFVG